MFTRRPIRASRVAGIGAVLALAHVFVLLAAGCKGAGDGDPGVVEGTCQAMGDPEFLTRIGCTPDFEALASEPLDITLPGARSTKVVLDQADSNALYFQNSVKYQIHYQFAST